MPPCLYTASVPVFLRYLARLDGLVSLAQMHAQHCRLSPSEVLGARIADGMLPFEVQVQVAANFALRACFPLAGQAVPSYGEFPASFDGLHARIARAATLVRGLAPADFDNAQSRTLHDMAGQAGVSLPASEFLFQYALPNFFFHMTVAYGILRQLGIAVGKEDFDGFHAYPR